MAFDRTTLNLADCKPHDLARRCMRHLQRVGRQGSCPKISPHVCLLAFLLIQHRSRQNPGRASGPNGHAIDQYINIKALPGLPATERIEADSAFSFSRMKLSANNKSIRSQQFRESLSSQEMVYIENFLAPYPEPCNAARPHVEFKVIRN
jgi:hypothetical protein